MAALFRSGVTTLYAKLDRRPGLPHSYCGPLAPAPGARDHHATGSARYSVRAASVVRSGAIGARSEDLGRGRTRRCAPTFSADRAPQPRVPRPVQYPRTWTPRCWRSARRSKRSLRTSCGRGRRRPRPMLPRCARCVPRSRGGRRSWASRISARWPNKRSADTVCDACDSLPAQKYPLFGLARPPPRSVGA
jgi:hypothetical protein|eukprot:COSAG06_NODE_1056_length_10921_cov_2.420532_4_plen_191_part_00